MNTIVCCFCAESINGEAPVEIAAPLEDGASQSLWAHAACLGARLHPAVPTLLPSSRAEAASLSEEQAYVAMFAFLEKLFEVSNSRELGALLGSLALLPDGSPADLAVKREWANAVASALRGNASAAIKFAKS